MREEERMICDKAKRLKAGELEEMSFLYEKYRMHIMRYVEKFAYYATDAEDLTHDVFEIAIANRCQLKDENKFLNWLLGIAHRQCMKRLRKRYQEGKMEDVTDSKFDIFEMEDPLVIEDKMIYMQLRTAIRDMIEELPEPQKRVIIAYFYHDLTLQQIAQQFNWPLGTVKTRLRTAKKTLRQRNEHLYWR